MFGSGKYYGNDLSQPVEQPAEYEVTADGVLTITRRWKGTLTSCGAFQHKVRSPMPLWDISHGSNPYINNSKCLCVTSRIYWVGGEVYMLEEQYQGTFYLPFSIYQWQTQRLDRPIAMHPRFNGTYLGSDVMKFNRDWTYDLAAPGIWNGFPNWQIGSPTTRSVTLSGDTSTQVNYLDGTNSTSATPNRYRGIEDYVVASGIWHRTSFTLNPALTTKLWHLDAPYIADPSIPASLLASIPDSSNAGNSWLKSQEDVQNMYRGASEIWQVDESWWYNSLGWLPEIYVAGGNS